MLLGIGEKDAAIYFVNIEFCNSQRSMLISAYCVNALQIKGPIGPRICNFIFLYLLWLLYFISIYTLI